MMMMMMVFGMHARTQAHTLEHIWAHWQCNERSMTWFQAAAERVMCSNICRSSQHSVRESIGRQFSSAKIFHRVPTLPRKRATRSTEKHNALHSVLTQTSMFKYCYRIVVVVLHFIPCAMLRSKSARERENKKI